VRLLPRGRGMKLPDELHCLTLHSLHLKRLQQNRKIASTRVGASFATNENDHQTCATADRAAGNASLFLRRLNRLRRRCARADGDG